MKNYTKIVAIIVTVLFSMIILVGCTSSKPRSTPPTSTPTSKYSLTGESVSPGYGNTYIYKATLRNTTNVTYQYQVSVTLFNDKGAAVATKSEYYILAAGGSGSVQIILTPAGTPKTYEAKVRGYPK